MIAAGVNAWKKLPPTGTTPQATPTNTVKPATTPTTAAAKPIAQPKPAPTGQSGIRQYLLDNGIGNDQIGYNKANNSVTVGGQSFITPAAVQGGTSYATKDSLDQALAGYQNKQTYNKANELMKTMEAGIGNGYTPGEFSYNAASDPQYLMALQNAYAQAGVASGNAMADFAARGILDSDVTRDRVSQIQQGAVADVNADLLPQMIQQAYQRYSDGENRKYQASRDQVTDRAALLSSYLGINNERQADAQQQWSNNFALNDQKFNQDMTTKQYKSNEEQRGLDNKYRSDTFAYSKERDKVADSQWQQEFDYNKMMTNKQFEQSVKDAAASRGIQWASLNQRDKEFLAEQTWKQKEFDYQKEQDAKNSQQQSTYSYSSDPDFADDMGMLMKNPTTALSEIQRNAQALISKYGYDGYEEFLKQAQSITPKE